MIAIAIADRLIPDRREQHPPHTRFFDVRPQRDARIGTDAVHPQRLHLIVTIDGSVQGSPALSSDKWLPSLGGLRGGGGDDSFLPYSLHFRLPAGSLSSLSTGRQDPQRRPLGTVGVSGAARGLTCVEPCSRWASNFCAFWARCLVCADVPATRTPMRMFQIRDRSEFRLLVGGYEPTRLGIGTYEKRITTGRRCELPRGPGKALPIRGNTQFPRGK